MKKVLGSMSRFIFAGFAIAVLALLMSLTYAALQRIFPDSFSNQMWGLVMFDIAAMCWAVAFVFQSKSVGQYAASGIGFIVAFLGTLGMVAAEVMLSGQDLANIDTAQIGRWMVYGFIAVTAVHALLVYAHHAMSPEIHEQINVGVARGEIVTEAIRQATGTLEAEKAELARSIHHDIVSQAKRDLGLHPIDDTVFDRRRYEQAIPHPTQAPAQKLVHPENILWNRGNDPANYYDPSSEYALPCGHTAGETWSKTRKVHECNICGAVRDEELKALAKDQEAKPTQGGDPDNYGPEWQNSEDVSPTLAEYAWVCLKCDGHNRPHTPKCSWCGQPRTNKSPVTAFADIPPANQEDEPDQGSPFPGPKS